MEVYRRILVQELAHQGGFVGRQIVQDDVNLLVLGAQRDDFLEKGRKATNSRLVWRAVVLPWTRPLAVSRAAYKDNVPWR